MKGTKKGHQIKLIRYSYYDCKTGIIQKKFHYVQRNFHTDFKPMYVTKII